MIEGPVSQTLYGALLFLHLADSRTREGRDSGAGSTASDELIAKLKPIREELTPVLSTGGDHLLRHLEQQRKLDRDWLKALLADIEAGGIRDVANPAALAEKANRARRSGCGPSTRSS